MVNLKEMLKKTFLYDFLVVLNSPLENEKVQNKEFEEVKTEVSVFNFPNSVVGGVRI